MSRSQCSQFFTFKQTHKYFSTSPSVYVNFPVVSARDSCGSLGPTLTFIALALAPGDLSTFEFDLFDGQPRTRPLNIADLPCGTWNGTNHWLPNVYLPWSLIGLSQIKESYQPLIALPSQFARMVPEW